MNRPELISGRPQEDDDPPPSKQASPVTLDTSRLFAGGQNEVRLLHRGQEYRLRITRQGKLILTK